MFPILTYIALFILTIISGVLTGILGVGGGIILLPFLTYLNFTVQQAIAITLFLMPISGLLLTMVAFVVLDTAIGIYVSIKLKGWASFKSTKFFNLGQYTGVSRKLLVDDVIGTFPF